MRAVGPHRRIQTSVARGGRWQPPLDCVDGPAERAVAIGGRQSVLRVAFATVTTLFILLFLYANVPSAAYGQGTDLAPEQQRLVEDLEGKLIAPCCWTQTVSVHESQAAESVKMQLRSLAASGKNEDEIVDYMVGQYGEKILAAPRASGFNALAYILPVLAILAGAAGLTFAASKWSGGRKPTAEVPTSTREDQRTSDLNKRMEEELSSFDV